MSTNDEKNKDILTHEPVKGYKKIFASALLIAGLYVLIIFIFS